MGQRVINTNPRCRTDLITLMALFGICLKKPLGSEEIGSRHPGMSDPEADASFAPVDEVVFVEQIDHIKAHEHFLTMPRQWNCMGDGHIVNGIGVLMG